MTFITGPSRLSLLALLLSCSQAERSAPAQQEAKAERAPEPTTVSPAAPPMEQDQLSAPGGGSMADEESGFGGFAGIGGRARDGGVEKPNAAPKKGRADNGLDSAPAVRAWFPESFMWQPLVETDASGLATVGFTVPDTLTTWRILALGQTRAGALGGATHSFLSTLPAYVEVAAPLKLRTGDVLALPVQVVNQLADPLRGSLNVRISGGSGQGGGSVGVAGWGSSASTVRTVADRAGTLEIEAVLTTTDGELVDSVRRSIAVVPVGRPIEQSRAGTLGGPRTLSFDPIGNANDGRVLITVFPGALSVVRAEVDLAGGRGGDVGAAAYAFAISRGSAPLIASGEVKANVVRDIGLVALQRLTRATRSADGPTSAMALAGLGSAEGTDLAATLGARLADVVSQAQQPDGLWAYSASNGLDDQLVASARCLWALSQALPADSTERKGATLRFVGALERFADRLTDPYVAAWALTAAGPELDAATREALEKTVRDALVKNTDGSLRLDVTLGATSAQRLGATSAEATAVALLALAKDEALRADLATGVLSRWTPGTGFGPGWSGLTALPAIALAMGGEVPSAVTIRVTADGQPVGESALDPTQKHAPVTIIVPKGAGEIALVSEPAVPGLAFTAVATSWVPWVAQAARGLEVRVTPPERARLGLRDVMTVELVGPVGALADVDIALPAGVDAQTGAALDAVIAGFGGAGPSVLVEEGAVRLRGALLADGTFRMQLPVTATLSGALQSGPATVSLADGEAWTALPQTWVVAP